MNPLVLCLLCARRPQDALVPGDAWTIERTYHYLNEGSGVDLTQVERTEYKVDEALAAGGYVLSAARYGVETASPKSDAAVERKRVVSKLKFGGGGAPQYEELGTDPIAGRVDRMQWTAAEVRAGISWNRTFRPEGGLPAGKVTVRPHGMEGRDQSLLISYREVGSLVRGEGTATATASPRIVASLKLTLTNVLVPGTDKTAKVTVNQITVKGKS